MKAPFLCIVPDCGGATRVKDTRAQDGVRERTRACSVCGSRFVTRKRPGQPEVAVTEPRPHLGHGGDRHSKKFGDLVRRRK